MADLAFLLCRLHLVSGFLPAVLYFRTREINIHIFLDLLQLADLELYPIDLVINIFALY